MAIISIITPLLLLCLLGYFSTRYGWLNKTQLDGLSKFTFAFSIPAYLFINMATASFGSINSALFISFYLPVCGLYLLITGLVYFYQPSSKQRLASAAVLGLGSCYSNTIIVGLPILLSAMGEQVVALVFLIISFHSALLFTLTSVICALAAGKGMNLLPLARNVLLNPLIIAIMAGLLFNLSGIALPQVLNQTLVMLGKPAISCALFVLGGTLTYYQLKKSLALISLISVIKLCVLPALVYLIASQVFMLDKDLITVLVILTASPIGVNAYLIAANEKHHQQVIAGGVIASTIASVVTLSSWLYFLL
jgi:predicted permease